MIGLQIDFFVWSIASFLVIFFLNKKELSDNIRKVLDKQARFVDFPIIFSIYDKIIGSWFFPNILCDVFRLGIGYFCKVLDNDPFHFSEQILGEFDQFFLSSISGFWDIEFES